MANRPIRYIPDSIDILILGWSGGLIQHQGHTLFVPVQNHMVQDKNGN